MNEMNQQAELANVLKRRFDDSVRDLDADTVARIRQCRQQALSRSGRARSPSFWLPAGAVAAACLAVLIYSLLPREPAPQAPPVVPAAEESTTVLEQMEMITDLELYEDLEFYQWLEQHELPS
jgi:hypothetical protein